MKRKPGATELRRYPKHRSVYGLGIFLMTLASLFALWTVWPLPTFVCAMLSLGALVAFLWKAGGGSFRT